MLSIFSILLLCITAHLEAKSKSTFEKGLQLFDQQRYAEAIKTFDSALKKDASNPYIWASRGTAYFELNNFYQAINDYTIAINLSPNNGFFYQQRGVTYYRTGNNRAAVNDLIAAAKLGDSDAQIILARSRIAW